MSNQIMIDHKNSKVLNNFVQADLIRQWQCDGDIESRNKVMLANQRMVLYIAKKRTGMNSHIHFDEIVQTLFSKMPAIIDRFDPDQGTKFSVYLYRSLNGYSLHSVNDKWNKTLSLDVKSNGEDSTSTFLDQTEDSSCGVETKVILDDTVKALRDAMTNLSGIERKVIIGHFNLDGNGKRTLQDLGIELDRTKAGILSIQNRALAKLRKIIDC